MIFFTKFSPIKSNISARKKTINPLKIGMVTQACSFLQPRYKSNFMSMEGKMDFKKCGMQKQWTIQH